MQILIIVSLLMVMVMWGGSFVAIKFGLQYLTPYQLILARFIPSAILLIIIHALKDFRNKNKKFFWTSLDRQEKGLLLLISFLAVPGYHFCLNFGSTIIPAGWASLVISLNPACITVLAALVLRENISARQGLGIGLAFLGLLYIAFSHDLLSTTGAALPWWQKVGGIVIVLGAVLSWGGFAVFGKKLIAKRNSLEVLTWALTIGTLISLPWVRPDFIAACATTSLEFWGAVIFLSVGCTVISFIIWFWALKNWKASSAGTFIYLVPLIALISGNIFLDEPLDIHIAIGAVVVLAGVILAASGSHQSRK